jgi:hypothetical protein
MQASTRERRGTADAYWAPARGAAEGLLPIPKQMYVASVF